MITAVFGRTSVYIIIIMKEVPRFFSGLLRRIEKGKCRNAEILSRKIESRNRKWKVEK